MNEGNQENQKCFLVTQSPTLTAIENSEVKGGHMSGSSSNTWKFYRMRLSCCILLRYYDLRYTLLYFSTHDSSSFCCFPPAYYALPNLDSYTLLVLIPFRSFFSLRKLAASFIARKHITVPSALGIRPATYTNGGQSWTMLDEWKNCELRIS